MTTYESLLAADGRETGSTATTNAEQEVCQKIALVGLHRGGFFNHAAFYGGTCLRLFHGLPRFSEDMDFSLTEKRDDIHLENYFDAIREEFHIAGFDVTITRTHIYVGLWIVAPFRLPPPPAASRRLPAVPPLPGFPAERCKGIRA